eukprot:3941399-Rhodomonas_salina.8
MPGTGIAPLVYAMLSTDLAHGGTGVCSEQTSSAYAPAMQCTSYCQPTRVLCDARYGPSVCFKNPTAMCACYAIPGTDRASMYCYQPTRVLCDARYWGSAYCSQPTRCPHIVAALSTYAMFRIDIVLSGCGISLRACYPVPGTDLAYGATRAPAATVECGVGWGKLRYLPTRFPVLTYRIALHAYAVSGTHIAYASRMPGTDMARHVQCSWYCHSVTFTAVTEPFAVNPGNTCLTMSGTDLAYAAISLRTSMQCPILT